MKKSNLWKVLCGILVVVFVVSCTTLLVACGDKDKNKDNTDHTHVFGEWKVTKEATCTEAGSKERECACGEKETETIAALGHSFGEWAVAKAATCTEEGSEERVCANCSEKETRAIAKVAHVDADNDSKCDVCGGEMTDHTHVFGEWKEVKAATCTEAGSKERACACGEKETEVIAALGHNYVNGVCSNCGDDLLNPKDYVVPTVKAQPSGSYTPGTKLVVGYSQFEAKFSPFFATNAYDQDAAGMTQVGLLASDRGGNIIKNGLKGEVVPYNGTDYTYYGISDIKVSQNLDGSVDYTIYLGKGVKFSDGSDLTVKDVIFNMYVYSDNDYDGSTTFYSLPIAGMSEWRTNLKGDVLDKVTAVSEAILASYSEADKGYVFEDGKGYTQAQFDALTGKLDGVYAALAADIVAYVQANYASYAVAGTSYGGAGVDFEVEGQKTAFGMVMWGFGEWLLDGETYTGAFADSNGKEYTMVGDDVPTIADYAACIKAAYKGDAITASSKEAANTDFAAAAVETWIAEEGAVQMGDENVTSISGITYSEENYIINVHTTEFSATTIYNLSMAIAPMAYYGDVNLWDPANGSYGFTRNDLNGVREKTTQPLGAGPYVFKEYTDNIITYEANTYYWEGCPKIQNLMFKVITDDADLLPAVQNGDIDIANPSIDDELVAAIKKANNNSEELKLSNDYKVSIDLVDNNGYGYLGMNADLVKVGSDKASEESKNLRKAFATLFAAYRDFTVNSYYAERASVIQYPISNCSWAAPQPADDGYEIAYSKDVDGKAIYTADMTEEQRWAAAKVAAIGFLKAAGYTWDETAGKFTAAPDGAKMKYEVIVAGDGKGDHPNFAMLLKVKADLESIGLELDITDDNTNLFKRAQAGTVDMFTMAWGGSSDPDMYQIYHSDNKTQSNHYRIADSELDELILLARKSDDTIYRKSIYKKCLDIILDWGVEVPVYQRKNGYIFGDKVNVETITPDTTPYWTYLSEIYNLEVK